MKLCSQFTAYPHWTHALTPSHHAPQLPSAAVELHSALQVVVECAVFVCARARVLRVIGWFCRYCFVVVGVLQHESLADKPVCVVVAKSDLCDGGDGGLCVDDSRCVLRLPHLVACHRWE